MYKTLLIQQTNTTNHTSNMATPKPQSQVKLPSDGGVWVTDREDISPYVQPKSFLSGTYTPSQGSKDGVVTKPRGSFLRIFNASVSPSSLHDSSPISVAQTSFLRFTHSSRTSPPNTILDVNSQSPHLDLDMPRPRQRLDKGRPKRRPELQSNEQQSAVIPTQAQISGELASQADAPAPAPTGGSVQGVDQPLPTASTPNEQLPAVRGPTQALKPTTRSPPTQLRSSNQRPSNPGRGGNKSACAPAVSLSKKESPRESPRDGWSSAQFPDNSRGIQAIGWAACKPEQDPQPDSWRSVPIVETSRSGETLQHRTFGGDRARGRGRGRGGPGRSANLPASDSRWIKSSDIPTGNEREDVTWDFVSGKESSIISSCWADNGGAVAARRRAVEGQGIELSGWDGDWAPAPIDWDSRPGFRESQSQTLIEKWVSEVSSAREGVTLAIDLEKNKSLDGELAPRYWMPTTTDQDSLKAFWHEILASDEPGPADYGDLDGVKPWWERYKAPAKECQMVQPYAHLWEDAGVDPSENQFEKQARERDLGSENAAVRRKNLERAKIEAKHKKTRRRESRKDSAIAAVIPDGPSSDLKLYIRTAKNEDLGAVCEIFNHYVEFTNCVPETENLTLDAWKSRLSVATENELPFIVAYKRGDVIPPNRKNHGGDSLILPDTLVGFAFAKEYDHLEKKGFYKNTVEMEVYTHNTQAMKGVARCLIDQLLGQIDHQYMPGRGFEFSLDELESTLPPTPRKVQNIIVNVPYEKPERLEWIGRWLTFRFGFQEKGSLAEVGIKNGKSIHLAIFQRPCNLVEQ